MTTVKYNFSRGRKTSSESDDVIGQQNGIGNVTVRSKLSNKSDGTFENFLKKILKNF